jgi:hypothetical protein
LHGATGFAAVPARCRVETGWRAVRVRVAAMTRTAVYPTAAPTNKLAAVITASPDPVVVVDEHRVSPSVEWMIGLFQWAIGIGIRNPP